MSHSYFYSYKCWHKIPSLDFEADLHMLSGFWLSGVESDTAYVILWYLRILLRQLMNTILRYLKVPQVLSHGYYMIAWVLHTDVEICRPSAPKP